MRFRPALLLGLVSVGVALQATFTTFDERADPPGGYSVISGCCARFGVLKTLAAAVLAC